MRIDNQLHTHVIIEDISQFIFPQFSNLPESNTFSWKKI